MADNDCHIDDIPHTIIDRLHQISPESSVNRLIPTPLPAGLLDCFQMFVKIAIELLVGSHCKEQYR